MDRCSHFDVGIEVLTLLAYGLRPAAVISEVHFADSSQSSPSFTMLVFLVSGS
jgi:hypothetical protein